MDLHGRIWAPKSTGETPSGNACCADAHVSEVTDAQGRHPSHTYSLVTVWSYSTRYTTCIRSTQEALN